MGGGFRAPLRVDSYANVSLNALFFGRSNPTSKKIPKIFLQALENPVSTFYNKERRESFRRVRITATRKKQA